MRGIDLKATLARSNSLARVADPKVKSALARNSIDGMMRAADRLTDKAKLRRKLEATLKAANAELKAELVALRAKLTADATDNAVRSGRLNASVRSANRQWEREGVRLIQAYRARYDSEIRALKALKAEL